MAERKMNVVLTCTICFLMILMCTPYATDADNCIYAIEELNTYDNALFTNNPSIMNATGTSVRFVMNQAVAGLMTILNCDWLQIEMIFRHLQALVWALAVTLISYRMFSKNQLFMSVVLLLGMMLESTGAYAGFTAVAFTNMFVGLGTGMILAAFSFLVGKRQNWNLAVLLCAFALFVHVHEGIWGFVSVLLLWLADGIRRKKMPGIPFWGLGVLIAAISVCVLPVLVHNSKAVLTDAEFVNIYSVLRHPHHLLPSAWGKENLVIQLLLYILPLLLLLQAKKHEAGKADEIHVYRQAMLIIAFVAAVATAYVFTEKIPVALISELFLSKAFKFVSIYTAIILAYLMNKKVEQKEYAGAAVYVMLLFLPYKQEIVIMLGIALAEYAGARWQTANRWKQPVFGMLLGIVLISFLRLFPGQADGNSRYLLLLFGAAVVNGCLAAGRTRRNIAITTGVMLVLSAMGLYGRLYNIERKGGNIAISPVTSDDYMLHAITSEEYGLALDFKEKTEKAEIFLADPLSGFAVYFQIVSNRSCYVLWKTVPSSTNAVAAWYERYRQAEPFHTWNPDEVYGFMKQISCRYVLVEEAKFNEYDQNGNFDLFCQSDTYRIYSITGDTHEESSQNTEHIAAGIPL